MPSSPEVWPHESLIAQDKHGKGRPEGTPKGTATTVMALNASEGVREAVAQLACPCPRPPHPRPGHRAQRATSRGATGHFTSAHTRSRFRGSRGTPGPTATWSWSDPERGEAGTSSSTPLASHSSRPPLPPLNPHYAHSLAACRGRPRERLPPAQRLAQLLPRRTLRAPSTCRASLARVVTAP